jgi:trypsin
VASPTRYPYYAYVGIVASNGSFKQCGGTLIHEDIILTAAHCYDASFDKSQSFAEVGLYNTNAFDYFPTDNAFYFDTIVKHPNYNPSGEQNDVMIIKLSKAVTSVKPVKFNWDKSVPATGVEETLMGFGAEQQGASSGSTLLREVKVKAVSYQECAKKYGGSTINEDRNICAFADGKDSCQGDSGGPAIIAGTSSANDLQVGIVSFGNTCGGPNPGVYVRVSNYADWIQKQVCDLSSNKPAICTNSIPPTPAPVVTTTPKPTAAPTVAPTVAPTAALTKAPTTGVPTKPPIPKGFCFSGETKLETENKGPTLMKDLQLGDNVLAATGKYEKVYSFGHRHESVRAEFLQLLPSTLEISRDHMLLVRGRYVPASAVQVGDELESASGDVVIVEAINTVVRTGVYAPFTSSGTIVVSNIKASNYIAFQDSGRLIVGGWETPFTYQWIAHMSQSPHRILSQLGLSGAEEYTVDGMSTWIAGPHELSQWLIDQNGAIVTVMLVPAVGLGMLSMAVERVVSIFV